MMSKIILHNDTAELPRLMSFIETIGDEFGIAYELIMQLQLALEEAVVNVMLYAYPSYTKGDIEVKAEYDNGKLTFYIEDKGLAFNPTLAPEVDTNLSAEDREIGGLGIHILRNIMDEMEYHRHDERNILRLTKIIN